MLLPWVFLLEVPDLSIDAIRWASRAGKSLTAFKRPTQNSKQHGH
jgi:hypothetical protein